MCVCVCLNIIHVFYSITTDSRSLLLASKPKKPKKPVALKMVYQNGVPTLPSRTTRMTTAKPTAVAAAALLAVGALVAYSAPIPSTSFLTSLISEKDEDIFVSCRESLTEQTLQLQFGISDQKNLQNVKLAPLSLQIQTRKLGKARQRKGASGPTHPSAARIPSSK